MPGSSPVRKILVVEDEAAIADTLAIILSTRGYQVRVAYTAEKAIEVIAGWQPDVAVVDVMLPQMNGIDFSIILKDNYPACRVLLYSGQPDAAALVEEAVRKGHQFPILAKPVHPDLMVNTIESLLAPAQELLSDA
jgi:DNA-binding NtrC family response regulator